MLVIATDADGLERCRIALERRGVDIVDMSSPSSARRLLLGRIDGEEAEAAALRAGGWIAVVRPDDDGGVRAAAWARDTAPSTFGGGRLGVCVAWSEHDRPPTDVAVELGTGGFGNGSHPTTALLLELLVERIGGGERVLDVGCGSGVLGLAAVALGAAELVAVDVKPGALEATSRNAALNAVAERVTAVQPPLGDVQGRFDVIVANVGRAIAVEHAPEMVARLAPGGWLAVSGINASQADQIGGFLRPLVEVERRIDGDWAAVVYASSAG